MKRTIQKWVDNSLTDALLENPKPGTTFILDYDSELDSTKVQIKSKKRKPKEGDSI